MRLVVLAFPLCSSLLRLWISFVLHPSLHFERFIYHHFVCGHTSRWFDYWVSFYIHSFLCLTLLLVGSFLCFASFFKPYSLVSFPSLVNNTHIFGPKPCLFPLHLIILPFSCPLRVGLLIFRHFERLLCLGFLECFWVLLVHRHVCFFIFNGGLSFIFVKGIVLVAYSGSWALVAFFIASRFMLDFHLLLLESINK
jgi:hypothetical protein